MIHLPHAQITIHVIVNLAPPGLSSLLQELENAVSVLTDKIAALQAEVTDNTSVITSAVTLINGIGAIVAAAVNDALAAGATPEVLASLDAVAVEINTASQSLADAVAANTPTS